MKPGELERNLSRLVEVARTARERLAAIEREMTELRHDLETLAARAPRSEGQDRKAGELAGESASRSPASPASPGAAAGAGGPGADPLGPEAGSE